MPGGRPFPLHFRPQTSPSRKTAPHVVRRRSSVSSGTLETSVLGIHRIVKPAEVFTCCGACVVSLIEDAPISSGDVARRTSFAPGGMQPLKNLPPVNAGCCRGDVGIRRFCVHSSAGRDRRARNAAAGLQRRTDQSAAEEEEAATRINNNNKRAAVAASTSDASASVRDLPLTRPPSASAAVVISSTSTLGIIRVVVVVVVRLGPTTVAPRCEGSPRINERNEINVISGRLVGAR